MSSTGTLSGEIVIEGVTYKITTTVTPQGQPEPEPGPELEELNILKVVASGDDGNVANNVLDPSASRWSCADVPCTLDAYVGWDKDQYQEIGEAKIRFFRGNERTANFDIAISMDGTNFTTIMSGQQGGGMVVTVDIKPDIHAMVFRYIGKGNSLNSWTSIERLQLFGKKIHDTPTPEPEPEPEPCPPGQHRDPARGQCVPDTEPEPPGATDKNGITYLFPVRDERFDFDDNFRSDGKRFDFENFMGQPGCEIGAYFKINNDASDEVSGKGYGGGHSDDNPEHSQTYDIGLNFEGDRCRLRIEHEHPDYTDTLESESLNLGEFNGRWVGFRFLYFNIDNNTKCRMVVLVDNKGLNPAGKPHNAWEVIADWTDSGQYPHGPYVTYPFGQNNAQQTIRVDKVGGDNDLDWYGVFCRKIDPTKPLTQIVK